MAVSPCDSEGRLISPPVWASLQDFDAPGYVRLWAQFTMGQLDAYGIELTDGMKLVVYDGDADDENRVDDLIAVVTAQYDNENKRWVAPIPSSYVHFSELDRPCQDAYASFRPKNGSPSR